MDLQVSPASTSALSAIAEGNLRQDLFYRLGVVNITVPPAGASGGHPLLAKQFIMEFNKSWAKCFHPASGHLKSCFQEYHWPGNVREFQHVIEHAMNIIPADCSVLTPEYIFMPSLQHPPAASRTPFSEAAQTPIKRASSKELSLNGHMQNVEREAICKVPSGLRRQCDQGRKAAENEPSKPAVPHQALSNRPPGAGCSEAIQSLDFS